MTDLPVLDAVEQRVLGSLMEKQVTVPATYPLTLNALRTACNQSSSRDPVTDYDEATLTAVVKPLRERGLLRVVWADSGRRTLKYHQVLTEELDLTGSEAALLTVLLLRGPQAPGELRTRTERLHPFADRDEVERLLAAMAARTPALVRRLPRRPGQKDERWMHLLGPDEGPPAAEDAARAGAADDREGVLAAGAAARDERVRDAYDAAAERYAEELADELDDLPFERWLLERVADEAPGPVVDAGCGPGHVTARLATAGADARGLDLSPAMVAEARRRFPGVRFEVGDLRRLARPEAADGWGAVLGWYSLIHTAPSELADAVAALARPLTSGGLLVLGLHAGSTARPVPERFGLPVELDLVQHRASEVVAAVERAGLTGVEWYRRGPRADRGERTERLYLLARRP